MRKKQTAAEIAAREAKKARMRELGSRIAALTPEQRNELAARAGIRTIEGRSVSTHNACMLFHQLDGISVVGGFNQWRKAGRYVSSGKNSGLTIWAPTGHKDPETDEIARTGFVAISVWDISQTKPFPEKDGEPITTAEQANSASAEMIDHLNNAQHAYEIEGKLIPVSFQLETA